MKNRDKTKDSTFDGYLFAMFLLVTGSVVVGVGVVIMWVLSW